MSRSTLWKKLSQQA
ncbi:hypothetical protein [Enterocloster sp.]